MADTAGARKLRRGVESGRGTSRKKNLIMRSSGNGDQASSAGGCRGLIHSPWLFARKDLGAGQLYLVHRFCTDTSSCTSLWISACRSRTCRPNDAWCDGKGRKLLRLPGRRCSRPASSAPRSLTPHLPGETLGSICPTLLSRSRRGAPWPSSVRSRFLFPLLPQPFLLAMGVSPPLFGEADRRGGGRRVVARPRRCARLPGAARPSGPASCR